MQEPVARRSVYGRGGLEFERPAFFTDAVFAIAMTLLIVSIAVPALRREESTSELVDRLQDLFPQFVAFFIGFAVLGNYWVAQHRFYGLLVRVDERFIIILVFYLAFVAWLPFPTALLGEYAGNPISVVLFAVSASAVSSLEAMLLWRAYAEGMFRRTLSRPVFVHAMRASLIPVAVFLVSIPIAFVNTYIAIASWVLSGPAQAVLDRRKPADFDETYTAT